MAVTTFWFEGAVLVLAKRQISDLPTSLIVISSITLLMRFNNLKEPVLIILAGALGLLLKG